MNLRLFFIAFMISLVGGIHVFGQSLPAEKPNPSQAGRQLIIADFMAEDTVVTVGHPLAFTNLSTGNPNFFQWNIEGGSPSIVYEENPVVIYNFPGVYDVQLIVSGSTGSDTLVKNDYIHVIEEPSLIPPGWEYNPSFTQHTIIIMYESNPRIFETPIQPGDFIGVFYEDNNGIQKCGGAIQWEGAGNTAVVAQGDNYLTAEKDGFMIGETFAWKLYSWEYQQEFTALATYDPLMQLDTFIPNAISVTQDLSAGTVISITIPEGWSGISSFVQPWFANLNELFAPHLDDVEMIFDGEGCFMPAGNLNTIGTWENNGYQIKLKNSISLEIEGYVIEEESIDITTGWNIVPVPSNCTFAIPELCQGHLNSVLIVQEIAGNKIFWPEFNIFTLQTFEPGRAYLLKSTGNFTIHFDTCE